MQKQNQKPMKKTTPTYLTKTYGGTDEALMVAELALIDRNIADIFFPDFDPKETPTVEQVLQLPIKFYDSNDEPIIAADLTYDDLPIIIGDYMSINYTPQLLNKRNIHTAWFISSNKITVRSDRGFTLAIDAEYTINDEVVDGETRKVASIISLTVTVSSFKSNMHVINTAEKFGYVKTDPKARRN